MRLWIVLRAICVCLIIWGAASSSPAWSATRHVVLLFDERDELPGLSVLADDLVATLFSGSSDHVEIYRETMDLSRFDSDNYRTLVRDFLRAKYADKKIDVAVAVLGPALDFLLKHGDTIFPGTPIVFCGVDRRELGERPLPAHIRGVLVKREFAPTLELALSLHPHAKQAFIVAGTSEFDTQVLEQARSEFRAYENRLGFTYLTALPLQKLLTEVSQLPPQSIVLFTTFFRDGAGENFVPHDIVRRISEVANAPVYGFVDQYLGRGIVGGSLYSFSAHGTETAKLILQVMANQPSAPTLVELPPNKGMFDWRQMQRWGIAESALPAGSDIRFRDLTLWTQYKWYMVLILTVILLQAGLISWLLHEHQYRRRAELAARESMSDLAFMNRRAAAGELSASIAHEVNQPLSGIVTRASAARNWLARETPDLEKAREALDHIVSAGHRAAEIIQNVRAMFQKDAPDDVPIRINRVVWAVLALVQNEIQKYGVDVETELDSRLPTIAGNEVQLQQVVLNLVMNAIEAMHSTQRRVLWIKSRLSKPDTVQVSIEDTGPGINPSDLDQVFKPLFTTKERGMGMGLSICRSIIESHGGRIWVSRAASGGSIFQFELPTSVNRH